MKSKLLNNLHKLLTCTLDFLFPPSKVSKDLNKLDSIKLINKCKRSNEHNNSFITSIFDYKDKFVSEMLWELKFYKNEKVADLCAPLVCKEIYCILEKKGLENTFIIPVPITNRKRRYKGFNQTEILCQKIIDIDKKFILNYCPKLVKKIRNTKNQHDIKNKQKRLTNLNEAFVLNQNSDVKNKNFIIVDDVTTTGATILEIKNVLKKAGAKNVYGVTIAH